VLLDEVDKGDDEPETLSDIDDAEVITNLQFCSLSVTIRYLFKLQSPQVDEYLLHNEEEKHYKKIIWEEMNKEYLEVLFDYLPFNYN
jgi:Brf1-like TBP-binding domain